jgi:hypothetical protein
LVVRPLPRSTKPEPVWVYPSICAASGVFLFALFVAALFQPSLRVLHALQALIYIAVIVSTRRNSLAGFGAGCFTALFWNYLFLRGAAPAVWAFVTLKEIRPDVGLQLGATVAHFLLIVACLVGFLRLKRSWKDWVIFLGSGFLSIDYVVVLILTLRPQMVPTLKACFGL